MTLKKSSKPQREVPEPKGPFAVGCMDVMNKWSSDGVFFRLFYPSENVSQPVSPDWLPDERYLEGYAIFFKIWPPLFCKTFPKFVGDVHIPASKDSPPLRIPNQKFPVVVFSHGLGGCRTSYTTFCLELASNGFIVAAIEHRDYSACNTFYFVDSVSVPEDSAKKSESGLEKVQSPGLNRQGSMTKQWMLLRKVKQGKGEYDIRNKQVHYRARECSTVLDYLEAVNDGLSVQNVMATSSGVSLRSFEGLIDTNKAAVAGHSFGGATVIATMAVDRRFKAGLGLDTWMLPLREETSTFNKVEQPMLFINMKKFQTKPNLKIMKNMESSKTERKILTLKGTVHLNQCDVPFLCDRTMRRIFGAHSRLDRFTAMDLTTRLSMNFLHDHLGLPPKQQYKEYVLKHQNVITEGIRT